MNKRTQKVIVIVEKEYIVVDESNLDLIQVCDMSTHPLHFVAQLLTVGDRDVYVATPMDIFPEGRQSTFDALVEESANRKTLAKLKTDFTERRK